MRFKQWCEDNGVKADLIEFPVAFGKNGELIGMAAKQDIPTQKAFLFLP